VIYGDLRLRDRLFRALVGATIGGALGALFALRASVYMYRANATGVLVATILGAGIGFFLAFRRWRVGA
jgi:hypothetical protein